jgi:hypothetical protein
MILCTYYRSNILRCQAFCVRKPGEFCCNPAHVRVAAGLEHGEEPHAPDAPEFRGITALVVDTHRLRHG